VDWYQYWEAVQVCIRGVVGAGGMAAAKVREIAGVVLGAWEAAKAKGGGAMLAGREVDGWSSGSLECQVSRFFFLVAKT